MPTNPNILLGLKPVTPVMPAQIEQLQAQRAAQQDLAEQRRLAAQQKALELRDAAVYQRIMEHTGGDLDQAEPLIRQYVPSKIKDLNADRAARSQARKQELDFEKTSTEMGLGLVGVLMKNPSLHAELAPIIAKRVPDLAGVIGQLDPNDPAYGDTLSSIQRAGMTAKDQIEQEWRELDARLRREEAALGRAVTMRGQDISAETARAGQAVTMRGQDLSAQTAREGHQVTLRGQNLSAPVETVLGPDGKPVIVPRSQAIGRQPVPGADGGGKLSAAAIEKVAGVDTALGSARTIKSSLSKYESRLGPVAGRLASGSLMLPSADQGLAEFAAEVATLKNAVVKATTGAAMSEPEARRIMSQVPDLTNQPAVFRARLASTMRNMEMLKRRTLELSGSAYSGPAAAPTTPAATGRVGPYTYRVKP